MDAEREASGAALRIRAAKFPAHKLLEEFNFDHQPAADRNLVAHLGTGVFLEEAKNVVLLGPPGTGKQTGVHRRRGLDTELKDTLGRVDQQLTGAPEQHAGSASVCA